MIDPHRCARPVREQFSGDHDRMPIALRPTTRADLDAIDTYFDSLDVESRRLRFHGTVKRVPPGVRTIFGEADQRRRITRVALRDDGTPVVVGEAMLVASDGSTSADIALSVSSRCRRVGIGARLLESLIDAAAHAQLDVIHADALAENDAFVGLASALGFQRRRHPDDRTLVRMTLRVDSCRGADRAAA